MNISIAPNPSLVDEPVRISFSGLQPRQNVKVTISRISRSSTQTFYLSSYAEFIADDYGQIDLSRQSPIDGTYEGIDPMGLFWSLQIQQVQSEDNTKSVGQVLEPQHFTLTVESGGQLISQSGLDRLWLDNDIVRNPIREDGLVATYFSNKDGVARPGIIVVGGSEGGLNEYMAALLASHGFSTLALAYFGIEHLPKRAAEIPLEYVQTAIQWMESRHEVVPNWLGIHGTSKGGELALLSGAYFNNIKAVVCLSGVALSFAGIVPWSDAKTLPPSWTYENKPIPYATPENPVEVALECLRMFKSGEGGPFVKWYQELASDPEVVKRATIPVEGIQGPVLFISGQDDGDVSRYTRIGVDRLAEHDHPFEVIHLDYPGGTHAIGIPYVRVTIPGQDAKSVADASVDSWNRTKDFLQRSFRKYNGKRVR